MEGWNGEGADEVPAVILWAFFLFCDSCMGFGEYQKRLLGAFYIPIYTNLLNEHNVIFQSTPVDKNYTKPISDLMHMQCTHYSNRMR